MRINIIGHKCIRRYDLATFILKNIFIVKRVYNTINL